MDRKTLMNAKLEELKKKQKKLALEKEMERISQEVEGFNDTYRFADDTEKERIERFISKLDFSFPGHIDIKDPSEPGEHGKMYLCFPGGSSETLKCFICGDYADFVRDIDEWQFISSYLLMIDEDFKRYVYIDDNGKTAESSI